MRLDIVSRTEVSCQTEVADLYLVAKQENVQGLEVVVNDISAMQIVESRANLRNPVPYFELRKGLFRLELPQRNLLTLSWPCHQRVVGLGLQLSPLNLPR